MTTEKDRKKHAERPDFRMGCAIWFTLKDFGTSESHSSEKAVEVRLRFANVSNDGRAKIDKFNVKVCVDNTVFVFDIAMGDTDTVKMPDGFDDLGEYPTGLFFGKA